MKPKTKTKIEKLRENYEKEIDIHLEDKEKLTARIIELETEQRYDEALELAFRSPYETFELYQEYRDFDNELGIILNDNFIL